MTHNSSVLTQILISPVPPEDYTAEDGFSAVPAASTLRPQRAPKRQFAAYEYTSEPGDVLFFRESWGHVVYTHKGPNIMINYRNIIPNNFLRQPITFLTALINALVLGRASKVRHHRPCYYYYYYYYNSRSVYFTNYRTSLLN